MKLHKLVVYVLGSLFFGASLLMLIGCTDEGRSRDTLYKAGYSDVKIGGYAYFECSDSDNFATEFKAKNPKGDVVSGTVCCGLTKGCTIRF
jgi:hypothetical protein